MKIAAVIVLFLLFFGASAVLGAPGDRRRKPAKVEALDVEAMLDAIAQVESGNNPRAIGRHGELSAYQIMQASWERQTKLPFWRASEDPVHARLVARRHLEWTMITLERNHAVATPALVATAWRFGPGQAGNFTHADSTRRTLNIYFELLTAKQRKGAR